MKHLSRMIALARQVRRNAYAPYSKFKVGACLRTRNGRLFAGANVENAVYPQGNCAEASAIAAMVAGGEREIVEIVVLAGGHNLCSPCGSCRQRLAEFARPATRVHMCGLRGLRRTATLGELLPLPFGRANLRTRR